MIIEKRNKNSEQHSPSALTVETPSVTQRLARFSMLTLSSLGLSLLMISSSFATVNDMADPAKFDQHTTIRSFNETTSLAEEIWATLTVRFVNLYEKGEYNSAHEIIEQAHDIALNNFGLDDVNTADTLLKLGIINQTLGNLSAAEDYLLGSLVILEEQLSPDHPDVAVTATNLGNIYYDMNRFQDSERYHQMALRIRKNALGNSNPIVAQSIYNLAVLFDREKMYGKAESHYQQAIDLWSSNIGPTHPYVGNALNSLTNIYSEQLKYKDAANSLQQTVSYKKAVFGEQHEEVAQTLINLGTAYLEQGDFSSASSAYVEALDIAQGLLTSSDPQLALLMYTLANIYHMQARVTDNVDFSTVAATIKHDSSPSAVAQDITEPTNDAAESVATDTQQATALFEQALPLYEKAAEILDSEKSKNWSTLDVVLTELAMLYKAIGNADMATATESRLSSH